MPHIEEHIASSANTRDFVIGMADGLTVPFALAAGLSGAVDSSGIIIAAGIAEIAAGAVAMGLGGYLGARTEAEHYESEYQREVMETQIVPHKETEEVVGILTAYGVEQSQAQMVAEALSQHPEKWVDFMMRFELGLDKPDPRRLLQSPLTIGSAYVLGGIIPLAPYFFTPHVSDALAASCGITLVALAVFGAFRGHFTGVPRFKAALQTVLVGSAAALCAYTVARMIA